MEIWGDYHIHTRASDGQGHVADKFACASARGLREIAVADHGYGAIIFHQTDKKFDAEKRDVERANGLDSVKVYQSIEATPLNEAGDLDVPDATIARCDILHFSFHRLIQWRHVKKCPRYFIVNGWGTRWARSEEDLVEFNTRVYLNVLDRYPVDVICHLNHRARVDVRRICTRAAEDGVYVELNEKHIETLEDCIDTVLATDVEFILGSDAHRTSDVGNFTRVKSFIERHAIPPERICGVGAKPHFRAKADFGKGKENL